MMPKLVRLDVHQRKAWMVKAELLESQFRRCLPSW